MSQETGENRKNPKQTTCWKCGLVCKNKQGLSVHQNKCLSSAVKGASFYQLERQDLRNHSTRKNDESIEKVLPASQTTPDETPSQQQVTQQQSVKRNVDELPVQEDTDTSIPSEQSSDDLLKPILSAYETIVKWRKNLFELPKGAPGKAFVTLISSLIDAWCSKTEKREFALYAIAIMPNLLLQKTNNKAKGKENKETLTRRLEMWNSGKITELLREGEALQKRLPASNGGRNTIAEKAKRLKNLVIEGKINPALRLLDTSATTGILPINSETCSLLKEKHPDAAPMFQEMLLNGPLKNVEPVIFESITGEMIQKLSLKTKGAAGPSLFDADDWKRMMGTKLYGAAGTDLSKAVARFARILCTEEIEDPRSITALMACRLIPLDKNPGLRPIGIGEVLRRIIGKAVTSVLKTEMRDAAGGLQLCVGHEGGVEAGIHGMKEIYDDEETQGVIQVDANNAFNTINRGVLLHNIRVLCPELATFANNCYTEPARLFVTGGLEMPSSEGTTQGCPAAMPMYAIGIIPLMSAIIRFTIDDEISINTEKVKQAAFADDLTGAGKLTGLRTWWDAILEIGKFVGYYAKPSKSWLIVKEQHREMADQVFADAGGIKITSSGKRHLGAVIGSDTFKDEYVNEKIGEWVKEIEALAEIALIEPHAAYAAYVHGFQHKFTFVMRTIPGIENHLKKLDDIITNKLIKNLFNRECSNFERKLFSLPVKLGGLGINVPSEMCQIQYKNSIAVTKSLVNHIVNQKDLLELDEESIKKAKRKIKADKEERNSLKLAEIRHQMQNDQKRQLEIISEVGASSWLNAIPLKRYGFHLEKQSFRDALYLRYGFPLPRLPLKCVCGAPFNEVHGLNCQRGGFVIIRHNEVRDLTAELLSEVCNDVAIEPALTPLSGEEFESETTSRENDSRCDVAARGFWMRGSKAFLDVRVFNPMARTYANQPLATTYNSLEKSKKAKYNERILNVEHGTFTPLILSCFGGMGTEAHRFFNRLGIKVAEKRDEPISSTISLLRTKLSFSLLRSALLCIRGSRSHKIRVESFRDQDISLAVSDAHI